MDSNVSMTTVAVLSAVSVPPEKQLTDGGHDRTSSLCLSRRAHLAQSRPCFDEDFWLRHRRELRASLKLIDVPQELREHAWLYTAQRIVCLFHL